MRVWTIQPLEFYLECKNLGVLKVDPNRLSFPEWKPYYEWYMKTANNMYGFHFHEYPIWVWEKKPKLERKWFSRKGSKYILLELEIEEYDICFTDFILWHDVINDFPITFREEEYNAWEKGEFRLSKEETWLRVFKDQSKDVKNDWIGYRKEYQGITYSVPFEKIVKEKVFINK